MEFISKIRVSGGFLWLRCHSYGAERRETRKNRGRREEKRREEKRREEKRREEKRRESLDTGTDHIISESKVPLGSHLGDYLRGIEDKFICRDL